MNNRNLLRLSLCLALAGSAAAPIFSATAANEVSGERSLTQAEAPPSWRARIYPDRQVARLGYGEMSLKRLLDLQRKNAAPGIKAIQIGIGRDAATESAQSLLPPLRWVAAGRGAAVSRIEIRSADALALRVGLRIDRLDDRVELRFAGSDDPTRVVAAMRAADIKRLLGDDGLFWTPNTDGERQIIEIYRPAGVAANAVRLQAPKLSHLIADSRNSFKIIEKIGESGSCNVDTICRVNELGPNFVNVKNAVAHMRFVRGSSTFICTGTLVADSVPVTQIAYFHGANHCFSTNTNVAPVPSQMQTVANTLNTFWNYETTGCGNLTQTPTTQLSGGAAYLYSNNLTDGMLLRLNNAPPSFAYFAGWNSAPLANGSAVMAIHHPAGDSKKVSTGQYISRDGNNNEVGWLNGTTEGGSSGSGLFTLGKRGYVLRGGLYGGNASCANTGSISNPNNRDYYSRLDVDIANLRQYLAPEPIQEEGSQPLTRNGAVQPTPPAPQATTATPATNGKGQQPGAEREPLRGRQQRK
jgi:lysyl endopeptidase